jgi:hypothetical protein
MSGSERDNKKVWKAAAKYIETKGNAIRNNEVAKYECKKVMAMSADDIKAEKKKVGKAHAVAVLGTIGSVTITSLMGSPVSPVFFADSAAVKTGNRVSAKKMKQIETAAYAQAARDIMHPAQSNDSPDRNSNRAYARVAREVTAR